MSETATPRQDRWSRLAISSWAIVGVLVILAAGLWLLARIATAIIPLALALVIIFLLKRPVGWMEERGLNRTLAVVASYALGALGLGVLLTVILPPLIEQVRQFIEAFPHYYDRAYQIWLDMVDRYEAVTVPVWLEQTVLDAKDGVILQVTDWSRRTASGVFAVGGQAVGFFINIVLSAVIAFYVLKDLPRLREGILGALPERRRTEARHLYVTVVQALGGYLRGQLIVSAIVGVLAFIGLALLGVPFPLVIGLITGLFNIVPYLGPIIGGVVAGIAGAFVDPWLAFWAVLMIIAIQQVDGLLISPRVMSEQVDLHPVLVIFSMLVGGTLMGFVGLLIAIPIAAVAKGVIVYYMEKHGLSWPEPMRRRADRRSSRTKASPVAAEDAGTMDTQEG